MDAQERIEAHRRQIEKNNAAWLKWSEVAAAMSVDELRLAKLIGPDQADFACRIITQQLHMLLVSGYVPPN